MAIINESGIKRDTDASEPLVRHSSPNRLQPQDVDAELEVRNEPRRSNLSNGSELKKSSGVAKPSSGKKVNNPIQQANQKRNSSTNYTRPNQPNSNPEENNDNKVYCHFHFLK